MGGSHRVDCWERPAVQTQNTPALGRCELYRNTCTELQRTALGVKNPRISQGCTTGGVQQQAASTRGGASLVSSVSAEEGSRMPVRCRRKDVGEACLPTARVWLTLTAETGRLKACFRSTVLITEEKSFGTGCA